uniref:Piwi domain-containing protein n=1 Tax=Psilocybe cubensis TaxID=181762 RepID=A0A8H7Y224_PSICU
MSAPLATGPQTHAGYVPIKLVTNAFEITQLPTNRYYSYDVFTPECHSRHKRVQLMHHLQITVAPDVFKRHLLFDGRSRVYSDRLLSLANTGSGNYFVCLGKSGEVDPSAKGTVQIHFTLTNGDEVDARHVYDLIRENRSTTRALVATNLIQLIVRQFPNMHHTNNGRAYFAGNDKFDLGCSGLELWRGVFQSVRPTIGKMILNVDTCTATIYKSGYLPHICMDKLGTKDMRTLVLRETDSNFKILEKFLKGVRITVRTGANRSGTQTIRGLVPAAGDFPFLKDGFENMTVSSYFFQTYNICIQNPRIIGVRLTSSRNPRKDVIPLELCDVQPGQFFKRKLSDEMMADMMQFSTMIPQKRLKKIKDAGKVTVASEFVLQSGMRLESEPMRLDAKLLHQPPVVFDRNSPKLQFKGGQWNALDQRFTEPREIKFYIGALPHVAPPGNGYNVKGTMEKAVESYFKKSEDRLPSTTDKRAYFLRKLIAIVILPLNAGGIRDRVKHWGDITQGVATQCIRENKLLHAKDQYWTNVALKINARLGGVNFYSPLDAFQPYRFMIMGADVGHSGPTVNRPSVTGVVYSLDNSATQYAAVTGIQASRVERIMDLKDYVLKALRTFIHRNDKPPRHLIFYRDGISEGEFNTVAPLEIEDIRSAFALLWVEKRKTQTDQPFPLLTYIVVGKRHHSVFFQEINGEVRNAFPGSLIDSGITHPSVHDFYLQSHAAIQGTSRSSHYTVLVDENWNFNMPEIHKLSYKLCHNYARATRSVSIPAPVYYADLVCSRGMFHINPDDMDLRFDDNQSSSSGTSNSSIDMNRWKGTFKEVHPNLLKSMYFL